MNSFETLADEIRSRSLPVICCGAGRSINFFIKKMEEYGLTPVCICDGDSEKQGKTILNIEICSLEQCMSRYSRFSVLITVITQGAREEIIDKLIENGVSRGDIFVYDLVDPNEIRDACAQFHLTSMDSYYEDGEDQDALSYFWDEKSPFYQMFQYLNLDNVLELACGKGRHVQKYISEANNITLVDILSKNITACEKKFSNFSKVKYLVNGGSDFSGLIDNSYSAIFTYDAMVHFESIDIYYYLKDTYRILKSGGRALFHHSNNTADYTQSFINNVYLGRSYMSAQLFGHYAHRSGLKVLEQRIIDCGGFKELDCLTLVEKP